MSNDYKDIQIESSMPKPWEEEETFNDVLYEWMKSGPWLLLSGGLHLVAFLIVANIPWSIFDSTPDQNVQASIEQAPEPEVEEPEEPEEEIEEEEEVDVDDEDVARTSNDFCR